MGLPDGYEGRHAYGSMDLSQEGSGHIFNRMRELIKARVAERAEELEHLDYMLWAGHELAGRDEGDDARS